MSQDDKLLKLQSFVINKNLEIGRGQFGIVYQCQDLDRPTLNLCAKIIEEKLDDPKTEREISLMKMLMTCAKGNKNIVGVEHVHSDKDKIVLILEKCESDLQTIIQKKKKEDKNFHPNEALNVLKQVVNGYKVLYSNNVIHRDLKPANILVLEGIYKIADLGLARVMETTDADKAVLTKVGTPKYVAPQLYFDTFFSNQADIFSLGIITYELIFGGLPYVAQSQMQIRKALKNLEKVPVEVKRDYPGMTNDFANLIESMLKFKENDRISWEQLFKHPLIQEGSNAIVNQSGFIQDIPNDDDDDDDEPVQVEQQPIENPTNHQSQVPEQVPIQSIPTNPQFPLIAKPTPTINSNFIQGRIQTSTPPTMFVPGVQGPRPAIPFTPPRFQTTTPPMALSTPPMAQPQMVNIGQTFQFQQVQAQSDQLFQAGVVMDQTLDLLEKFINMQIQLKSEWFGLKLCLHYFSQCFFEHSKAMKTQGQNQQNFNQQFVYQVSSVDQAIEKQKRYHQVISNELEKYQLNSIYPIMAISPNYNSYLQQLRQIIQTRGVFLYQSDRKYYQEYLQLLYCLERFKDLNQAQPQFEELYALISDIFKNQKMESVMIDYLNKRYSN